MYVSAETLGGRASNNKEHGPLSFGVTTNIPPPAVIAVDILRKYNDICVLARDGNSFQLPLG